MIGIMGLVNTVVSGVREHFEGKRKIKQAIVENKIRLAQSTQEYNQDWEMKQLDNVGLKDDILFYSIIAMFVWSGFDPEGAKTFFINLNVLPEWFIKIFFWVVASVVGVKKVGDYLPGAVNSLREAMKRR